MATLYASDGDTIIISRRNYLVSTTPDGPTLVPREIMCEGCGENDASDYEFGDHHLCPRCVERALEAIVLRSTLTHLIENDSTLQKTLQVFDSIDLCALRTGHQHVDAHSSAWDMVRANDEDQTRDWLTPWIGAIVGIIHSGVFVER